MYPMGVWKRWLFLVVLLFLSFSMMLESWAILVLQGPIIPLEQITRSQLEEWNLNRKKDFEEPKKVGAAGAAC